MSSILYLQATEDKYVVTAETNEACIIIKNSKVPPLTLTIHLTSPVVREDVEKVSAGGKFKQKDLELTAEEFFYFYYLFFFMRFPNTNISKMKAH